MNDLNQIDMRVPRDVDPRPGTAQALDDLTSEIANTDALLANLTNRLGPALLEVNEGTVDPTEGGQPVFRGSDIQRYIREQTHRLSLLNQYIRDLTGRLDV